MSSSIEEYEFGPAVTVPIDLPVKYHPIDVDLPRLGNNLRRDFPELRQSDWDKAHLHITHELPRQFGQNSIAGIAVSSDTTLSGRIIEKFNFDQDDPTKYVKNKLKKLTINGKLCIVGLRGMVKANGRLTEYSDTDFILSHELYHVTEFLKRTETRAAVTEQYKKYSDTKLAVFGSAAITSVLYAGALTELAFFDSKKGIALLAGGIATAYGTAIGFGGKQYKRALVLKTVSEYSERDADAYSIATRDSWAGVISYGEQRSPYL